MKIGLIFSFFVLFFLYEIHSEELCEIGEYGYPSTCVSCPNSRTTLAVNTTGVDECYCAQNNYGAAGGGTCSQCRDYSVADPGSNLDSSSCECDLGYEEIGINCVQCGYGEYKDQVGNQDCSSCGQNKNTKIQGATLESDCECDVGYYDNSGCTQCLSNSFKDEIGNSISLCKSCKQFSTSSGGSTSANDCQCNSGYRSTGGGTTCSECPIDTFKTETSNAETCTPCSITHTTTNGNTGRTSSSDCQCEIGYFKDNGNCVFCGVDKYKSSWGDSQTLCQDCPAFSHAADGSDDISDCICEAGYYRNGNSCDPCPVDTYKTSASNQDINSCLSCPTNTSTAGIDHQSSISGCVCMNSICNGKGNCTSASSCDCFENDIWGGDFCTIPICFNTLATDSQVCGSKGNCEQPNTCVCSSEINQINNSTYHGLSCNEEIGINTYFDATKNQFKVRYHSSQSFGDSLSCASFINASSLEKLSSPVCKIIEESSAKFLIIETQGNSLGGSSYFVLQSFSNPEETIHTYLINAPSEPNATDETLKNIALVTAIVIPVVVIILILVCLIAFVCCCLCCCSTDNELNTLDKRKSVEDIELLIIKRKGKSKNKKVTTKENVEMVDMNVKVQTETTISSPLPKDDIGLIEDKLNNSSHLDKENEKEFNKKLFNFSNSDIKIISVIKNNQDYNYGSLQSVEIKNDGNKMYLLKSFAAPEMFDADIFQLVERQVQLISTFYHPALVSFYGATVNPSNDSIGLVIENCAFGNLKDYFGKEKKLVKEHNNKHFGSDKSKFLKKMHFSDKVNILKDFASSLEYLHSLEIIHKSLAADCIMLDEKRRCKLSIDFGISNIMRHLKTSKDSKSKKFNPYSPVNSHYIAPEVTLKNNYSEKSDVFSFGMIAYELVTSNFSPFGIFKKDGAIKLQKEIANDPNKRPALDTTIFNESKIWIYDDIIEKCFSHDPSNRLTIGEIKILLQRK